MVVVEDEKGREETEAFGVVILSFSDGEMSCKSISTGGVVFSKSSENWLI